MRYRHYRKVQGLSGDNRADSRTKLTDVRATRAGIQVGAKMELRREESNSEEQSPKPSFFTNPRHVVPKTQTMPEWLRGQAKGGALVLHLGNQHYTRTAEGAKLDAGSMKRQGNIFGRKFARRALALLACATVLYFAAGGTILHNHSGGSGTACHICQSLHMPALAAAALDLVYVPELVTWNFSLAPHTAPSNSFALHRASRAPPSA